ncbi:MAG TPA: adenosylcobinamide-GDP ribazoletransferase, partial [Ilumatobacteraceae bacterium]|nr:adenosylcobinamide-GDP ribazoletransferase [Ilumatobacteraceae bacterium]
MVRLSLLAAIQFLTRIPIRLRREPDVAASVIWFPIVGALVGAGVGGIAAGLWYLVPPIVAAAVAVALGLLITGAFHEDGLA